MSCIQFWKHSSIKSGWVEIFLIQLVVSLIRSVNFYELLVVEFYLYKLVEFTLSLLRIYLRGRKFIFMIFVLLVTLALLTQDRVVKIHGELFCEKIPIVVYLCFEIRNAACVTEMWNKNWKCRTLKSRRQ